MVAIIIDHDKNKSIRIPVDISGVDEPIEKNKQYDVEEANKNAGQTKTNKTDLFFGKYCPKFLIRRKTTSEHIVDWLFVVTVISTVLRMVRSFFKRRGEIESISSGENATSLLVGVEPLSLAENVDFNMVLMTLFIVIITVGLGLYICGSNVSHYHNMVAIAINFVKPKKNDKSNSEKAGQKERQVCEISLRAALLCCVFYNIVVFLAARISSVVVNTIWNPERKGVRGLRGDFHHELFINLLLFLFFELLARFCSRNAAAIDNYEFTRVFCVTTLTQQRKRSHRLFVAFSSRAFDVKAALASLREILFSAKAKGVFTCARTREFLVLGYWSGSCVPKDYALEKRVEVRRFDVVMFRDESSGLLRLGVAKGRVEMRDARIVGRAFGEQSGAALKRASFIVAAGYA